MKGLLETPEGFSFTRVLYIMHRIGVLKDEHMDPMSLEIELGRYVMRNAPSCLASVKPPKSKDEDE